MINKLSQLALQKKPWLALGVSALFLEIAALFFQYAMDLDPCIKCVYQRAAVFGIMFAGFICYLNPQNLLLRVVGFAGWGISSIWGLLIAKEHVDIQTSNNPFLSICGFEPNFPSWLPLHEWIPAIFKPTGMCGEVDWHFLGFSMPQVMLLIFAGYSLSFAAVLVARVKHSKIV